jgi:hypothetical protein
VDTNQFTVFSLIVANVPDVAAEIASRLALPFERLPFSGTRVIGEQEALELRAIKILKMNRLYMGSWIRHHFPI